MMIQRFNTLCISLVFQLLLLGQPPSFVAGLLLVQFLDYGTLSFLDNDWNNITVPFSELSCTTDGTFCSIDSRDYICCEEEIAAKCVEDGLGYIQGSVQYECTIEERSIRIGIWNRLVCTAYEGGPTTINDVHHPGNNTQGNETIAPTYSFGGDPWRAFMRLSGQSCPPYTGGDGNYEGDASAQEGLEAVGCFILILLGASVAACIACSLSCYWCNRRNQNEHRTQ